MKAEIRSLALALATLLTGSQQRQSAAEPIQAANPESPEIAQDVETFLRSLPQVQLPKLDDKTALSLAALPLSCIDHLQNPFRRQGYHFEITWALKLNYEKSLAFYGCSDWHSAVNSTWALAKILKTHPDLPTAKLIREKLNAHLGKTNIEGEMAFFKDPSNKNFEVPYGLSWLLKLYTELYTWEDPDAKKWAETLAPLAQFFSERLVEYLNALSYPMRVGTHANTAFNLSFMLDFARAVKDEKFMNAVVTAAKKHFSADKDCPTAYEPSGSDFFSPCLTEAELMSKVLSQSDFVKWFNAFMPAVHSAEFRTLATPVQQKGREDAGQSHLLALPFVIAADMNRVARALPEKDRRKQAYEQLAAIHIQRGFETMYDADYTGTHYVASWAVYSLTTD